MIKKVIILLFAVFSVSSKQGIDVSQRQTEDVLTCLINKGYINVVARAYQPFGAFDSNAVGTLANAQKAGMQDNGVYLFPCISQTKTAQSQVN